MALDPRAPHINERTSPSFYAFGLSSSSAHLQADHRDGELPLLNNKVITKSNNNQYLKLHQQGHIMQGGGSGKVMSDSNDDSLISFEDSNEAAAVAGGHCYEHNSTLGQNESFSNSHQISSSFSSHLRGGVTNRDDTLDWFYSADGADDQAPVVHKRAGPPSTENECLMPPIKKQCTSTKKSKQAAKPSVASKDPQSIAAKNRRERISERLKILQELVPNGTKVDLVTMLEKAIGYVKFLQLQVKVLAADEFWPVQGGKAPQLSQVKDAIDAILLSQRSDRNSASE